MSRLRSFKRNARAQQWREITARARRAQKAEGCICTPFVGPRDGGGIIIAHDADCPLAEGDPFMAIAMPDYGRQLG